MLSEAQKLRWPAHDSVTSAVTVDLVNYNFGTGYRGEKEVTWSALEFGLDSDVFAGVDGGYDYCIL